MAGESAGPRTPRQRERAELLTRPADGYRRSAHPKRVLGAVVDSLRADGWVVFDDVRWPGRARAVLDHVVVGPGGIFVVDAMNWSGRVEIAQNTFWCRGSRQDQAVAAGAEAAVAAAAMVSAPAAGVVRSVLCFVRDEPLMGWCFDVMVCSTANLRELLVTRPLVLTPDQVRVAAVELEQAFKAVGGPRVVRTAPLGPPAPPPPPTPTSAATSAQQRRPRPVRPLIPLTALGIVVLVAVPLAPRLVDDLRRGPVEDLAPVIAYETCRTLHRDHPEGVGTAAAVNALERSRRMPTADDGLYEVNASLDDDLDEVACERTR